VFAWCWDIQPVLTSGRRYSLLVTFPGFAGKHEHEEFLSPSRMRDWRQDRGMLPAHTPERVIFVYQDELWAGIVGFEETTPIGGKAIYARVITLDRTEGRIGVIGGFGIGAPAAAAVLEDLIAIGVQEFLSIGTAGALQPDLEPGDVVVCTSAIRDEGVSHHYTRHDALAAPDEKLTEAFAHTILDARLPCRRGASWTIDAPYRETAPEARHYQGAGVLCVEMEAAALFTVASYRGAALASAFCISDSLADAEWNPLFDHPVLAHNLLALYGAAVDTPIR
jgi:uridine phosphorylase